MASVLDPTGGSLQYVNWKERRTVAQDLRAIYQAATIEAAEQERELLAARWDHKYPTISALWRRHWEQITPLFAFPPEIRKVIYTTNAVESLHMTLRKVIKTRGSFPNEESALKLLYLDLRCRAYLAGHSVAPAKVPIPILPLLRNCLHEDLYTNAVRKQ